jgi:hypothetical protein
MVYEEKSLQHFGIFGMKWGVRRFQNEDGTLTEEGRKRYLVSKTENGKEVHGLTKEGERAFFKNGTSQLTKEGRQFLDNASNDEKSRKAVDSIRFERNYAENWINTWNSASDIFNVRIQDINDKYGAPNESEATYKKYIKEVNDMWQKTYSRVLLSEFGEHPEVGKRWLNSAYGYTMYENYKDHVDDEMRERWKKQKNKK